MKVLFLDFDGVLNSIPFLVKASEDEIRRQRRRPTDAIDPEAVKHLNSIVDRTGCKVVISSTWRKLYRQKQLERLLKVRGFVGEIIGMTPRLYRTPEGEPLYRGNEIQAWIDAEPTEIEAIVILDDDSDMEHLTPWLVATDVDHGLTAMEAARAVEVLGLPGPGRSK